MARFSILQEIERLDPNRDHQRIVHLSFGHEFPWDSIRALELALYRTYCVPSISRLLDRTGEFAERTQRRYDDTGILVAEMCKWGYEDGRGRDALDRINWAHRHYQISNDDYRYVLSTFVFEPVRWIDRFGWRKTTATEREAFYWFWRNVGTRMGITDIPASYAAFEAWSRDYERDHFRFDDANGRVGRPTRDLFASWAPKPLAPLVRLGVHALLDDTLIAAFGFPQPSRASRAVVTGALKARGHIARWLPPVRGARFFMDQPTRSHPSGYRIDELGPPKLIDADRRRRDASSDAPR